MTLSIDQCSDLLLYYFMLLKITEKILLYGNKIILFILLYLLHNLLYWYPDYIVDIVTVIIIELS